jgi:hypothetical protein
MTKELQIYKTNTLENHLESRSDVTSGMYCKCVMIVIYNCKLPFNLQRALQS